MSQLLVLKVIISATGGMACGVRTDPGREPGEARGEDG